MLNERGETYERRREDERGRRREQVLLLWIAERGADVASLGRERVLGREREQIRVQRASSVASLPLPLCCTRSQQSRRPAPFVRGVDLV